MYSTNPAVSHHFMVNFLFNGIPNPLDIAFQRISGLSRQLDVKLQMQGGENVRNHWLAEKISHGSLILERGVMNITPMTLIFDRILRGETLSYACVIIILLNAQLLPITTWTLSNALPVRWQTSDLDANSNKVLINTLELRYQDMRLSGGNL